MVTAMSLLKPKDDFLTKHSSVTKKKLLLTPLEMTIFAMLGALMFCSKILTEVLPNVHFLGMFTMVFTLCYRKKGLIPIYVYVLLNGIYAGFATWWIPYLYLWTILWAITMLLPQRMPKKLAVVVYCVVCGLHGLAFGTLYAPAQAILFGLDFKQMLAWIAAGFPYDVVHAIGNLVAGILIVPLCMLIGRLDKNAHKMYC